VTDESDAPVLPPVDPMAARDALAGGYSAELLAGLLADGDDDLAAWTISQAIADTSRVATYDGLVAQAMHLVGERWASGRWGVAEEHLASQTLVRALEQVRPQLGPSGRIGPLAVLAGVAGEHHAIGLILLDHLLAEGGWTVANLGADVPAADLGRFVEHNDPRLIAITASDPGRLGAIGAAVGAIRAASAVRGIRIPVVLGGRLANGLADPSALDLDGAGVSLGEAIRFADSLLAAGSN
jgi:MerR family transcriptional regulator, light-induced transcriptional regulator